MYVPGCSDRVPAATQCSLLLLSLDVQISDLSQQIYAQQSSHADLSGGAPPIPLLLSVADEAASREAVRWRDRLAGLQQMRE